MNNIDDIIGKFISGEASPEEAMFLEQWKQESSVNEQYFNELWKVACFSSPPVVDEHRAWENVQRRLNAGSSIRSMNEFVFYRMAAAAVALFLLIGGLGGYFFHTDNSFDNHYIATTGNYHVQLEDHSAIRIMAGSQISYDQRFGKNNRKVHLQGNAYFSVTHNEQLPFMVEVNRLLITDIGTRFSVITSIHRDTITVTVDEGAVILSDSMMKSINVSAGERAIYLSSVHQVFKSVAAQQQDSLKNEWSIHQKSLRELVPLLEKRYNVNITLENESLGNCTITTHFTNETIETVLTIITETLGVQFEKTSEGYLIKGDRCSGE